MKEETFNLPTDSYFLSDCTSPEEIPEEDNFLSPEVNPENIFGSIKNDNSESQLSSVILGFPFTLDSFQLLYLKNKEDSELGGLDCTIILGNVEKIKFDKPILKLIFFSKDRKSPLNLNDFPSEINSLTSNPEIEFMCINQNKLFIQCENENITNEAYSSLQKSSTIFDLLYDEEQSINSLEEQNKGINSLGNSEKKEHKANSSNENIISSNKKEKNPELFNKFDAPITNIIKKNEKSSNFNYKKDEILLNPSQKNIWNSIQNNSDIKRSIINNNITKKSKTISMENVNNQASKEDPNIKQKTSVNNQPQIAFLPQLFAPIVLPLNNLQKMAQNPSLMMQIQKINPFLLQTALLMQNLFKIQQVNLKSNENKDKINFPINNISDFKGKTENDKGNKKNVESDGYSSANNKESSTNSNTSSTSSKESSPSNNYQNNNNNNINISNISSPLFNRFNLKINSDIIQNNKTINNINKDLLNNLLIDDKTNNIYPKNNGKGENNSNLEEIVLNKKYKEYVPKNKKDKEKEKEKEKDVKFHTNSTRDYQFKYVSRYIVQIENEKNFPVTKMIIGNNGKLLRQILLDNCINYGDHTTKIRLRGKGSGYKEGPQNKESKDPMELCISSLNMLSYMRCSQAIENLLLQVYYQYYIYQCNNALIEKKESNINIIDDNSINKKEFKDKNGCPIIMKKILKYQYVVNRYNTLVKEEKRRKQKEEEDLKYLNQKNNKESNHA